MYSADYAKCTHKAAADQSKLKSIPLHGPVQKRLHNMIVDCLHNSIKLFVKQNVNAMLQLCNERVIFVTK